MPRIATVKCTFKLVLDHTYTTLFTMYPQLTVLAKFTVIEWKCRRGANAGAAAGGSSPCPVFAGGILPASFFSERNLIIPTHEENGCEKACMKVGTPTATPKKAALAGVRALKP